MREAQSYWQDSCAVAQLQIQLAPAITDQTELVESMVEGFH